MSKSIQIRNATAGDATLAASLLSELEHPTSASEIPARMRAILNEGGAVLLAFSESGEALGLMCLARHTTLHTAGSIAYITALVTTASARRRGVGSAFVERAKEWAAAVGCARLSVTSAEHRADAHAFYPACGMPYTGRRFATSTTFKPE